MEPMGSTGASTSWVKGKANVIRIFEKFRTTAPGMKEKYPRPVAFDQLPEEALCDPEVYALFATYLTEYYKIETGQYKGNGLSHETAANYLSSIINQAAARFKATGSNTAKLFFTCLDTNATTDSAKWLHGLKNTMTRKYFEDAKMDPGCRLDKSATPLYLEHVEAMIKAYAQEGSADAAVRRMAILATHISAGVLLRVRADVCSCSCSLRVRLRPRALHVRVCVLLMISFRRQEICVRACVRVS